jgi:hypothetical protein
MGSKGVRPYGTWAVVVSVRGRDRPCRRHLLPQRLKDALRRAGGVGADRDQHLRLPQALRQLPQLQGDLGDLGGRRRRCPCFTRTRAAVDGELREMVADAEREEAVRKRRQRRAAVVSESCVLRESYGARSVRGTVTRDQITKPPIAMAMIDQIGAYGRNMK